MGSDYEEVVGTPAGPGELLVLLLVFCDDPSVLTHDDIATDGFTAVVLVRDVRVEADQAGKAAEASVGFPNHLFVVDALEKLAGQRYAGRVTTDGGLIEKGIRDELEALLDQFVVNFSLPLDLLGGLKLRGKSRLQLAKPHIVKPRRIHMIASDPSLGALTDFDGAVHGPIGVLGVIDGYEDFTVHKHLGRLPGLSGTVHVPIAQTPPVPRDAGGAPL